MKISDFFVLWDGKVLTIQSMKLVLRKSRNKNGMGIIIRVIPGHSTVLLLSLKFGFVALPTAKQEH
jgi:hypothetical protein